MIKQFFKKISVLTMSPTLDSGEPPPTSLFNRGVLDQGTFTASFVIKREGNPGTSNASSLMRDKWILNLTLSLTEHVILVKINEEAFKYPCGPTVLTKQNRLQIGYTYDYIYMDLF